MKKYDLSITFAIVSICIIRFDFRKYIKDLFYFVIRNHVFLSIKANWTQIILKAYQKRKRKNSKFIIDENLSDLGLQNTSGYRLQSYRAKKKQGISLTVNFQGKITR